MDLSVSLKCSTVFTGPSWIFRRLQNVFCKSRSSEKSMTVSTSWKIHGTFCHVTKSKLYPPKHTSNSLPELLNDQPFRSKLPTDKTLLGTSATKAETKHSFNMVSEGSSLDVKRKNAFKQTREVGWIVSPLADENPGPVAGPSTWFFTTS